MTRTRVALGTVLALVLTLGCSGVGNSDNGQGPGDQGAAPAAATTQAVTPTGPVSTFGDGTWEVGAGVGQVRPGKYRTAVPADSFGCYWERLKGTSGQFSDIIANENANPGSPSVVTIATTDKAFKSSGCGNWELAG